MRKLRNTVITLAREFGAACLELIYPRSIGCPFCQGAEPCGCGEQILAAYHSRTACPRCGKFVARAEICPECYGRGKGFPDRVYTLAPYEGAMRQALHRFKYQGDLRVGKFLGRLLSAGPGQEAEQADLIIPVPIHRRKLRLRGYNQAEVLGTDIAKTMDVKLESSLLIRTEMTQPQAGLGRRARRMNLGGAFRLTRPRAVAGKRIILIDDILTTGYTLESCGILLREAGAVELTALCVAGGRG